MAMTGRDAVTAAVEPGKQASVLFVNADAHARAATRSLFETRHGRFAVLMAETPERAVALAARHRPDAAVFDVDAGPELVPRLKYLKTDIACIATTSNGRDDDAFSRALRCGADDLLHAPVNPDALHQAIARYRERGRYARERAVAERRFRAVVEQTYQCLFLVSASGELLHANKTACDELGVESGSLAGRAIWDTPWWNTSPDLQRRLQGWLARAYVGEIVRVECEVRRPDGEARQMEVAVKPVQDTDGRLDFIMLECRDNTERNRLAQAQRRLAAIVEATPDLIGMADRDEKVFFLNAAGKRVLAEPDVPAGGRAVTDYFPEWTAAQISEEALPAARRAGIWTGETVLLARDGREIPASLVVLAHYSATGEFEYYSGVARDISERKRLEQALREANEALERRVAERTRTLQESEERFRQLAENIEAVFWITSADGNELSYISPAYERVWGRDRAEIYRNPWAWLEAVHAEDRARVEQAFRCGIAGQVQDQEYRIIRPDGTVRWIHDRCFPVCNASGKAVKLTGIAEDVTVQKEAREAIERSRDQLRQLALHQEKNREQLRTDIARDLHDEIGQSTVALKMNLHWLAKRLPAADEEIQRKIADMNSVIERTVEAVHRISAELRPLMLDDLGLEATLNWYLDQFEARSGIACRRELSIDDVPLDDRVATALYRIAQEVLTNVAKHAGAKRVDLTLKIGDRRIDFQIRDDGRGITAEEMSKSDSFGIVGMRERIAALQGTLRIEGRAGAGTTVQVSLPCDHCRRAGKTCRRRRAR